MLLPAQISMYALAMRRALVIAALSLVACGSYGNENSKPLPDAGFDVTLPPQDAGFDAATLIDAAKQDAADGASSIGVCVPALGAFCEDFDDPAGLKLINPDFIGGATATLLNEDGFTKPRSMRFEFPAAASSRATLKGPENILISTTAYRTSFYVRIAQSLSVGIEVFSINLKFGALQVITTGSSVSINIQVNNLSAVDARILDSQLVGFNVWQRIELVVDHAARTVALTVPGGAARTLTLPVGADIPPTANPSLVVGAGFVASMANGARYDIDSIEMHKVR
jgi:hypothetical protein